MPCAAQGLSIPDSPNCFFTDFHFRPLTNTPHLRYDYSVHSAEFPYLADWLAVTFRWLVIVGVAVGVAASHPFSPLAALLLAMLLGWNLFITVLAALNRRLSGHRPLNVAVDTVLALGLLCIGGWSGGLLWAGLAPLLSGAVYYGFAGSLTAAALLTGSAAAVFLQPGAGSRLAPAGLLPLAGMAFGLALLLGALLNWLTGQLRGIYLERLGQKRAAEAQARQRGHDQMRTFYQLTETLNTSLNYQTVLNQTLDLSASALGLTPDEAARLVSAVLLFQTDELTVAAARRLSPSDLRRRFPAREGALGAILTSGEPQQVEDLPRDPELGRILVFQAAPHGLCLPLKRGLSIFGVLVYAHDDPAFFNSERVELLLLLSQQVINALENARLFEDLSSEKERLITLQDNIRKQLARDLHDGPTQTMAAVAMRAQVAAQLLPEQPGAAAEELSWIAEAANRATAEIRSLLFSLRPLVLETEGLAAALNTLAAKTSQTYGQKIDLEIDELLAAGMDGAHASVVFSIVEEALTNACKHASASQVSVRLRPFNRDGSLALLEVADNGRGFDVQAAAGDSALRGSFGLVNLRERAEQINAYLNLQSAPGRGTRVQVFIPLTPQAVDRLRMGALSTSGSAD